MSQSLRPHMIPEARLPSPMADAIHAFITASWYLTGDPNAVIALTVAPSFINRLMREISGNQRIPQGSSEIQWTLPGPLGVGSLTLTIYNADNVVSVSRKPDDEPTPEIPGPEETNG